MAESEAKAANARHDTANNNNSKHAQGKVFQPIDPAQSISDIALFQGCTVPKYNDGGETEEKKKVYSSLGHLIYDPTQECVCLRAEMRLCCVMCGTFNIGRVRKMCPAHPRQTYLLDQECCNNLKCRAPAKFLTEFKKPEAYVKTKPMDL